MTVQPGLCQTWSEAQNVGFLTHRLNSNLFPIGRSEVSRHGQSNRTIHVLIISDSGSMDLHYSAGPSGNVSSSGYVLNKALRMSHLSHVCPV